MEKAEFGLRDAELAEVVAAISSRNSVQSALIFGSRAKGNYRPGSDVDIALKGPLVRHEDILEVGYSLNEETTLPYQFDVVDYDMIDNDALREYIYRVGREIFRRLHEVGFVNSAQVGSRDCGGGRRSIIPYNESYSLPTRQADVLG